MEKAVNQQFNQYMNALEDFEYLLSRIACQTAPTLFNIKPSSLISLTDNNTRNVINIWEEYKYDICCRFKVDFFELLKSDKRLLILFYRKERLGQYLQKRKNQEFLKRMGYEGGINLEAILNQLKKRFEEKCPHEIGIFLGFPVEDVTAFIEHKGAGSLLCGYWKVYHNPEQALLVFRNYDLARAIVMKAIAGVTGGVHAANA